jgi:hypothetical protein
MNKLIDILLLAILLTCIGGLVFIIRDKKEQTESLYDCRIITPETPERIREECLKNN